MTARTPIFRPGTILFNKYLITRFIGRGGFAEVYQAQHTSLKMWRALKVVSRKHHRLSTIQIDRIVARFRLEAQLGARLNSPFIVRVLDFDETQAEQGLYVLVMEFMPGGSLQQRLKQYGQGLPFSQVLRLAREISQGLGELHRRNFVHRDIKPANLLFGERGEAKIADLGIIQMPDHRTRQGPHLKSHPGTPAYMSPEQERSPAPLTPASDIYSFGLVLFEALTLKNPKYLKPGTWFTYLRQTRPDLPSWFIELLQNMLDPSPYQRPWDGFELYERLTQRRRASSPHPSTIRQPPISSSPLSSPAPSGKQKSTAPTSSGSSIDRDDLAEDIPRSVSAATPPPPPKPAPQVQNIDPVDDLLDDNAEEQHPRFSSVSAQPTPSPNTPPSSSKMLLEDDLAEEPIQASASSPPPPPPSKPAQAEIPPPPGISTKPTPSQAIPPSRRFRTPSKPARSSGSTLFTRQIAYTSVYPAITTLDANDAWLTIGTIHGMQAWSLSSQDYGTQVERIVDRTAVSITAIHLIERHVLLATTIDGRFIQWFIKQRQKTKNIFTPTPASTIRINAYSHHRIATVDVHGHIYIWQAGRREPLLHFQAGRGRPLELQWLDEELLVLAEAMGRLSVWRLQNNASSLQGKWRYPMRWSAFTVHKGTTNETPSRAWVGTIDGQIWEINLRNGRIQQHWEGHKDEVIALYYIPETLLLSLAQNGQARLWSLKGQLLASHHFPYTNISVTQWSDKNPWGRGLWIATGDSVLFYRFNFKI